MKYEFPEKGSRWVAKEPDYRTRDKVFEVLGEGRFRTARSGMVRFKSIQAKGAHDPLTVRQFYSKFMPEPEYAD